MANNQNDQTRVINNSFNPDKPVNPKPTTLKK